MNVGAAGNIIVKGGDEAIDLAKILYQASRAPYDSRVAVGEKSFKNLAGKKNSPFSAINFFSCSLKTIVPDPSLFCIIFI